MARQVKSKQRVADHGEVFTADREVNAMLDLVKQETERVDSRFLEPACGDGNFLAWTADFLSLPAAMEIFYLCFSAESWRRQRNGLSLRGRKNRYLLSLRSSP